MYLQKHTATETFAAGVVIFKGVAGLDTNAVDPLGFKYRTDGWCGAGAPRFNLRVENAGVRRTFMFDRVSGMIPSGAEAHEGRGFEALVTVAALPRARSSPWRSSSTRARPSSAHLWVSVTLAGRHPGRRAPLDVGDRQRERRRDHGELDDRGRRDGLDPRRAVERGVRLLTAADPSVHMFRRGRRPDRPSIRT